MSEGVLYECESEEIEFYIDMAMNECQRWLEVTCRELFIDSDDFIYSIRHGTHLRNVINKIIPNCFDLTTERFKKSRTTRQILKNAKIEPTEVEKHIEDEDWISQVLLICWHRLEFPSNSLFKLGDLRREHNLNNPYQSFIYNKSGCSDDDNSENDSIRRICMTIAELANVCEDVVCNTPQLDRSAVQPLISYHNWLNRSNRFSAEADPLQISDLEIVSVVSSLIDTICVSTKDIQSEESRSIVSDEGFCTMVECGYVANRHIADLSSEYSTEDLSCCSLGTKSSRSSSPYTRERFFPNFDHSIPTRQAVKTSSQTVYNPLQFISSKTKAIALCEQAKQQIVMSEQQKRIREETRRRMLRESDDETEWQSNLDSWLLKRKNIISTCHHKSPPIIETEMISNDSTSHHYHENKDKEEFLTITESSPLNDSGIDNFRTFSNSPSTSVELSPKRITENTNDFIISNCSITLVQPPSDNEQLIEKPSGITQNHLTSAFNDFLRKNTDLTSHDTSNKSGFNQIANNSTEFLDPVANNYSDSASLNFHEKFDRESPESPSYNARLCPDSPQQYYYRRQNNQTSADTAPAKSGLDRIAEEEYQSSAKNSGNIIDGVTLGVEVRREQSANITTVKFPIKNQKVTVNHSCKEPSVNFCESERILEATVESKYSFTQMPLNFSSVSSKENNFIQIETERLKSRNVLENYSGIGNYQANSFIQEGTRRVPPILRTVDIAFEDKPSAAYLPYHSFNRQKKTNDGTMLINIDLKQFGKTSPKNFGFTVCGGKDKHTPFKIETVVVDTPADRAGLLIGDTLTSINGESVTDCYYQSVVRMINEAVRLGEIELTIKRSDISEYEQSDFRSKPEVKPVPNEASFDEKRSMFDKKSRTSANNYYEFQKQTKPNQQFKWKEKQFQPSEQNGQTIVSTKIDSKIEVNVPKYVDSCSSKEMIGGITGQLLGQSAFPVRSYAAPSKSDYRVTSMHEKPKPGRLTDFIPEVERCASSSAPSDTSEASYNDKLFISECAPKIVRNYDVTCIRSEERLKTQYPSKEKIFPRTFADRRDSPPPPTPPPSHTIPQEDNLMEDAIYGSKIVRKEFGKGATNKPRRKVCFDLPENLEPVCHTSDDNASDNEMKHLNYEIIGSPNVISENLNPATDRYVKVSQRPIERTIPIRQVQCCRNSSKRPLERYIPIIRKQDNLVCASRQVLRKRVLASNESCDKLGSISHEECTGNGTPSVNHKSRAPLVRTRITEIIKENFKEQQQLWNPPEILEATDHQEWKRIISEQKFPNANCTKEVGKKLTSDGTASSKEFKQRSSTPSCFGLSEQNKFSSRSSSCEPRLPIIKNDYRFNLSEESNGSQVNKWQSESQIGHLNRNVEQNSSTLSNGEVVSPGPNPQLSISSKKLCAHCCKELGRGSAMIIESLKLSFHVSCFRCYNCNMVLGDGAQGASVRVRNQKLYCSICYKKG